MAIVTNSRRVHFEAMHTEAGLMSFFYFVLVREEYTRSKPDPEPWWMAMKKSGYTPAECLVGKDSPRGAESVFSAGIPCLVVPNHLTKGECLSRGLAHSGKMQPGSGKGPKSQQSNLSSPKPMPAI